jgi:hypothetical protein
MVKKLFALASVTALTGLVASVTAAGCSSTEILPNGDASTDAKREASRPADTDEPAAASCKAQGKFEAEKINPSAPQKNACSKPEIDALSAKCAEGANPDANSAACKDARDAHKVCAECIFGTDADAQWKVVNLNPDAATRKVRYNQAGCIEIASGVKDCGSSLLTLNICLNVYCNQCTTDADQTACVDEVFPGGECGPFGLTNACGTAALDTNKAAVNECFAKTADVDDSRLFKYMATLACGTSPITDAGKDADGS